MLPMPRQATGTEHRRFRLSLLHRQCRHSDSTSVSEEDTWQRKKEKNTHHTFCGSLKGTEPKAKPLPKLQPPGCIMGTTNPFIPANRRPWIGGYKGIRSRHTAPG